MSKELDYKTKFPKVITTKEVLGIEEGVVLVFDWASGKYVSITESEDVSKEEYYYSGYAIALDPYLVKDNIGDYFSYVEETKDEVEKHIVTKEDVSLNEGEPDIKEGEEIGLPNNKEYDKVHTLVIDCSCGHRSVLEPVNAPGVNITLMAEDETSYLELICPECSTSMRLWFAPDTNNSEDESPKEEDK